MIAVDAMGGDYAPQIVVQGAYQAALQGVSISLFGCQDILADILCNIDPAWQRLPLQLVNCEEAVCMDDKPAQALLHKQKASLFCAIRSVATGQCEAVVSAGNSGAILVGAVTYLKRSSGIMRPALASFLPTISGSALVLDLGANTDCKPEYLQQFAHMGSIFVQHTQKIDRPRVALISNGHEVGKGSLLIQKAYSLLEQDSQIHFVGNIESRDIFNGTVDVVVCDGFVGNVLLKAIQGTAQTLMSWMTTAYQRTWYTKLLGLCTRALLRPLYAKIDYKNHAGALLLGVQYPCIIAHGCASARAMEQTILYAHKIVQQQTIQRFNKTVSEKISLPERKPVSIMHRNIAYETEVP